MNYLRRDPMQQNRVNVQNEKNRSSIRCFEGLCECSKIHMIFFINLS